MITNVNGCQRKKLPNQKALSAMWRRLLNPASTGGVRSVVRVATAQG